MHYQKNVMIFKRYMRHLMRIRDKCIFLFRVLIPINRRVVLGRAACLGSDIFALRHSQDKRDILINQQKTRVDILCKWIEGNKRPKAKQIRGYMLRADMYPLIKEQ